MVAHISSKTAPETTWPASTQHNSVTNYSLICVSTTNGGAVNLLNKQVTECFYRAWYSSRAWYENPSHQYRKILIPIGWYENSLMSETNYHLMKMASYELKDLAFFSSRNVSPYPRFYSLLSCAISAFWVTAFRQNNAGTTSPLFFQFFLYSVPYLANAKYKGTLKFITGHSEPRKLRSECVCVGGGVFLSCTILLWNLPQVTNIPK